MPPGANGYCRAHQWVAESNGLPFIGTANNLPGIQPGVIRLTAPVVTAPPSVPVPVAPREPENKPEVLREHSLPRVAFSVFADRPPAWQQMRDLLQGRSGVHALKDIGIATGRVYSTLYQAAVAHPELFEMTGFGNVRLRIEQPKEKKVKIESQVVLRPSSAMGENRPVFEPGSYHTEVASRIEEHRCKAETPNSPVLVAPEVARPSPAPPEAVQAESPVVEAAALPAAESAAPCAKALVAPDLYLDEMAEQTRERIRRMRISMENAGMLEVPPPPNVRRISIASGGYIEVSVSGINLFSLTKEERALLFGIADQIQAHEAAAR